jgi:hypothetical protein
VLIRTGAALALLTVPGVAQDETDPFASLAFTTAANGLSYRAIDVPD